MKPNTALPVVATFSIVARDPVTGELGVATQSKFLAVGAVVPWAQWDAGAIATQSWANTSFGPGGLAMLKAGQSAQEALDALIAADDGAAYRQVGIVDTQGRAATFTGPKCMPWAGGVTGEGFAAQGNILTGPDVVNQMAEAYKGTQGLLAQRLVKALDAAQAAGGDSRGRQSAALLVVKEKGGYGGFNDRYLDLRVDDHPEPIHELGRLLDLWGLYFAKPAPGTGIALTGELLREVTAALTTLGYVQPGAQLDVPAFTRFLHTENFEERELGGLVIDPGVLAWLRGKVR